MRRRTTVSGPSEVGILVALGLLALAIGGTYVFAGINRGDINEIAVNLTIPNATLLGQVKMNMENIDSLENKTILLMDSDQMLRNDLTNVNYTSLSNEGNIAALQAKDMTLMNQINDLQLKDMLLMDTDAHLTTELEMVKEAASMIADNTLVINNTLLQVLTDVLMIIPDLNATSEKATQNMMNIAELEMQPVPIRQISLPSPGGGGPVPPDGTGDIRFTTDQFQANPPLRYLGHTGNGMDLRIDFPTMAQHHMLGSSGIGITASDPIVFTNTGVTSLVESNPAPFIGSSVPDKNLLTVSAPFGNIELGVRGDYSNDEYAPSKVANICPGDNTFSLGTTQVYWLRLQRMVILQISSVNIGNFDPFVGSILTIAGTGNCDPSQGFIGLPYNSDYTIRVSSTLSCTGYTIGVECEVPSGANIIRVYSRQDAPAGTSCVFNGVNIMFPTSDP